MIEIIDNIYTKREYMRLLLISNQRNKIKNLIKNWNYIKNKIKEK